MFDSQHESRSIHFSSNSHLEPTDTGRFFHFGSFDIGPASSNDLQNSDNLEYQISGNIDEARYNLATRVMSNGVEVIIAGDKNAKGGPSKANALRILPSLSRKPMTLAPSTLQDQMILVMPSNLQENYTIPINSNHFITKTCLTTYTYRTTYLQDGKTTVESREKVVSNTATEERNYLKISPTESLGVTLSRTPELTVGVFHTTYTYYNTILDGDLPFVVSSQHVLTNTITGPDDYISFLQPSEEATPVLETNTYFSKISLTKTLKESDTEKIVSTSNILTQVIITESLPPQSTNIMTSYITLNMQEKNYATIDRPLGNAIQRSDISTTDVLSSQFHTYTFYNAEINSNNTEGNLDDKLYLYMKKDTKAAAQTSVVDITNHLPELSATSDMKLGGSIKTDLVLYATKTYLTTFTYLTTLMSTDKNNISSAIVNFHTRVTENVLTENIASKSLLDKTPQTHSLVSNQTASGKLESSNVLSSVTTMSMSTSATPLDSLNEIQDSDVASSEIEEQYASEELTTNIVPKNDTKHIPVAADFSSVNQIIESLNLNRLQALGPVFNAMAGLIQNNFASNYNHHDLKKNISSSTSLMNLESKQVAKNISAYEVAAQSHDRPIYIPVQNLKNENQYSNPDDMKVAGFISTQSLHISPPEAAEWLTDEKKIHYQTKPSFETPLLNGGIPIRPGEVITANSDVIVGKPNGIQPRVPFKSKTPQVGPANQLILAPPPFSYHFQYQQHTNASPSPIPLEQPTYDKNLNFDGILKPPPLINPQTIQHQLQKKLVPPFYALNNNANYRAHYATSHMHQMQQLMPQHIAIHNQQQQRPIPHNAVKSSPSSVTSQKPNYIPYAPYDYDQQHPPHDKVNEHKNSDPSKGLNKDLNNNEIIEIKRIPEVYSTDLPGNEPAYLSPSGTLGSAGYKTLIKKVIHSDKPMLVDIQPSKITNIVIPRDNSASILIVESSVELHKNGQYYDEPTTYSDTFVSGSVLKVSPQTRKPILSNQQVNLDTNVLSHNVDINVPPITFKKDAEFPHSTPVRGQIQNKQPINFHMPHVTIPLKDNQIQVNLTPQNFITQNLSEQFYNDMIKSQKEYPEDNSDNQEPPSYQNIYSPQTQKTSLSQVHLHPIKPFKNRPNGFANRPQPKPVENTYYFGSYNPPHALGTMNFSLPQLNELSSKKSHKPFVIPLSNSKNTPNFRPTRPSAPAPIPVPNQEEYLQIFANVTPAKPTTAHDIHVPLVNLFYGLHNDGEKDLSVGFSQRLSPSNYGENYLPQDHIHFDSVDDEDDGYDNDDLDPTEGLNKIDDQKSAPSLNVGVPTNKLKPKVDIPNDKKTLPYQKIIAPTATSTPRPQTTKLSTTKPNTYLDSASVNAVNNMDEINIRPPPSPQSIPALHNLTMLRSPSAGRPFTKTKTTTRAPAKKTPNKTNLIVNTGQGFQIQHTDNTLKDNNSTSFVQIPLPVATNDPNKLQDNESVSQTEAPFNPKYIKRTNKPLKISTKTSTTTRPLTLNQMEIVNLPNVSHSQESAEMFDFHDSMNPFNYNYVHADESTTAADLMQQTNTFPFVSEPSVDMKPPQVSIMPQTEKVMGLNPPPPPTIPFSKARPVSVPSFTPSMSLPSTTLNSVDLTITNRNPLLPPPLYTTIRPVKNLVKPQSVHNHHTVPSTRPRTKITNKPMTTKTASERSSSKPITSPPYVSKVIYVKPSSSSPVSNTSISQLFASSTPLTVMKNKLLTTFQIENITPTLTAEKQEKESAVTYPSQPTRKTTQNDGKNGGSYKIPMFSLQQRIPDEILIEASEELVERTPVFKISENQTETISVNGYHRKQSESKPFRSNSQPSLSGINSRTRITSHIVIPTKYVTNTLVLTVTTTKISVLTSLGFPSTQTLTLTKTKTSTLVDTVTETHTLLQPTRVTESHTTTATQIIHLDYHPVGSIEPSVEIVEPSVENRAPPISLLNLSPDVVTPRFVPDPPPISNLTHELDNNSIFVVMTDKKNQGGVLSIGPSMMDTPQNINAIEGDVNLGVGVGPESEDPIELDYDDNITFDLPTRDEEAETNEVNHVLLGGVLIATPPKASDTLNVGISSTTCRPTCKASRNEICQQIDTRMNCACRPGFARMFPDRPCRPTYTYALQIPIHRVNKQVFHFKDQYRFRDSDDFKQLAGITHDAVDRMVMQSDLRDVYHGVHVTSFDVTNPENGILGNFLIQLSDNSDEKRLVDVFKKYLRKNNFSLGGTEIFTTKTGASSLEIVDFNECEHSQFNDCSESSKCFNLQGTYTCSCQDGYADLSENSMYPGRICSAEVIGCEKCHYHGRCVQMTNAALPVCECFSWYTGVSCQLNLKILLIALITIGTILFILLLFCVLVTCTRRKTNDKIPSIMSGIHIIVPKNSLLSSKSRTTDKRAMIKDSSSEASQNSLPYVLKRDKRSTIINKNHTHHQNPLQQQQPYKIINERGQPSSNLVSSMSETDQRHNYSEQNDRPLTVMIPRAKYHHSVASQSNNHQEVADRTVISNEAQLKSGPNDKTSTFHSNTEKISNLTCKTMSPTGGSSHHGAQHTTSTGALVSAGFEVSATVGSIANKQMAVSGSNANFSNYEARGNQIVKSIGEIHFKKSSYQDPLLQYNIYKEGEKYIDSMDMWLDTIQQNELTAEARSFDETTIQAPTKSLRSVFEGQLAQSNGNDEANTMAERDVGSTFLLPHTHLYKPDRDSDVSGFDSF